MTVCFARAKTKKAPARGTLEVAINNQHSYEHNNHNSYLSIFFNILQLCHNFLSIVLQFGIHFGSILDEFWLQVCFFLVIWEGVPFITPLFYFRCRFLGQFCLHFGRHFGFENPQQIMRKQTATFVFEAEQSPLDKPRLLLNRE